MPGLATSLSLPLLYHNQMSQVLPRLCRYRYCTTIRCARSCHVSVVTAIVPQSDVPGLATSLSLPLLYHNQMCQVLPRLCRYRYCTTIRCTRSCHVSVVYRYCTTIRCTSGRNNYYLVVVSSYEESYNNKPMYMYMYGYMLPNLSPSPNLYKVLSVYNNNVAS